MSICVVCVNASTFPSRVTPLLGLLRKRMRLSRELVDDVVRARGRMVRETIDNNSIWEQTHFDDYRHGPSLAFYASGGHRWKLCYVNGKVHGLGRYYYANGHPQREVTYVNGKWSGRSRTWREDGSLKAIAWYAQNRLVSYIDTLN